MSKLFVLLMTVILVMAEGSIYTIKRSFFTPSAYILSEGEMFVKGSSILERSDAKIDYQLDFSNAEKDDNGVETHVLLIDSENADLLGYVPGTDDKQATIDDSICCNKVKGNCKYFGDLNVPDTVKTSDRHVKVSNGITAGSFPVTNIGDQAIAMIVCAATPSMMDKSTELTGTVGFLNPHGYLPGKAYAFVPLFGVLSTLYIIIALGWIFLSIRNKESLISLQYWCFLIIVIATIENVNWLAFYMHINTKGNLVCCPLHVGAISAIVINMIKRGSSRCLLLAVCLGFGVVRPRLSRKLTIMVFTLGVIYAICAVGNDIQISNNAMMSDNQNIWIMPLAISDAIFCTWIIKGISEIKEDLSITGQNAKLNMYARLQTYLIILSSLALIVSVVAFLQGRGTIEISWKHTWMIQCFPHIAYFMMLATVCWIWKPSQVASQYAYSFQLPTSIEEADAYEMNIVHDTSMMEEDSKDIHSQEEEMHVAKGRSEEEEEYSKSAEGDEGSHEADI